MISKDVYIGPKNRHIYSFVLIKGTSHSAEKYPVWKMERKSQDNTTLTSIPHPGLFLVDTKRTVDGVPRVTSVESDMSQLTGFIQVSSVRMTRPLNKDDRFF